MISNVVVIALAAHFLDDDSQQNETVIAVLPLAAWAELRRAAAVKIHIVLQCAEFQTVRIKFRTENVARSTSMRQQMMNCDFRRYILIGIVGEVLSHRIIQCKLSCLSQLQDRDGRKHLVHGPDAKARLQSVGYLPLTVGKSVGFCKNRLVILGDENGA